MLKRKKDSKTERKKERKKEGKKERVTTSAKADSESSLYIECIYV